MVTETALHDKNRRIQAGRMSERELLEAVVECAQRLGYLVAHIPDELYKLAVSVDRPDMMAGAAGLPDLILVHPGDKWLPVIFAELKTERGRVRPMQQVWLDALDRESLDDGFVRVVLWKPMDWLDGSVERVLRNG